MRLYLYGHDYKYAAEQILLTLFPAERPEYPAGKPEGDRLEIRLSRGERFTTASCRLHIGGKRAVGRAAVKNDALSGDLIRDRYCQRLIKNAVYRAARSYGIERPAWGALTGVRPGKLLCGILASGVSEDEALRRFTDDYDVTEERARLCMDTARETMKAAASLDKSDVCLYVGIPFCPTRCAYCSFVSQSVEKSMKLIEPFMQALLMDISATAAEVRRLGLRVVSVYMGGGTPTTLSPAQLETLCTALETGFDLSALREYTVEAGRPDTITAEKLRVLRAHGVERLHAFCDDLGADAVARQAADLVRLCGHGYSPFFAASTRLVRATRPPSLIISWMKAGNGCAWKTAPVVSSVMVPVSALTETTSPSEMASTASGHSRMGRPMLIELR